MAARMKPQRDGWSTAQAPRLVAGHQLPDESVPPSKRRHQAEELRAAVEAHIASGGLFMRLSTSDERGSK
jgi:hypothetical protein